AKDDILDVLSIELIGVVPEDENVIRATNNGEPMTMTLDSPAAQAYLNIAERLLGRDVPLMDLESYAGRGFFSKIKKFFSRKKR
ncbi:MAG: septum site-determining protein MinD, partial [Synergistaceae bacterium]|nr:septum site-determining protein MinD [Synergistaceae bacterium]